MPEIAPWENPNLPTPFAHVEREIEGRIRRFALWHWDERLVWNDLDYPRLWWGTLDVAASLADWDRAIEHERFGRASSQSCNFGGNGQRIGLSEAVRFVSYQHGTLRFHVVNDAKGQGMAREIAAGDWHHFDYSHREPVKRILSRKHRHHQNQNICDSFLWRPDVNFIRAGDALLNGYKETLLGQISPQFLALLEQGNRARPLLLLRSLFLWSIHLAQNSDRIAPIIHKIVAHFGLPEKAKINVIKSYSHPTPQLLFSVMIQHTHWNVKANLPTAPSLHEALEAALYLKQELRPILTAAEIEEILAIPARP